MNVKIKMFKCQTAAYHILFKPNSSDNHQKRNYKYLQMCCP